jgi:hypothetical protein
MRIIGQRPSVNLLTPFGRNNYVKFKPLYGLVYKVFTATTITGVTQLLTHGKKIDVSQKKLEI